MKISKDYLEAVQVGLGKHVKVFERAGYKSTSNFSGCTAVEIDALLSKLKGINAPEKRKLRAALLKLGSDEGAGGDPAASPGQSVRTLSVGAQIVRDLIDSDIPITNVSWAAGMRGQDTVGRLRRNRGSSVIDAANMVGTTINDRFLIQRNSGATVSSGSSMLFVAEDMETGDMVMLKFIKDEPEFKKERGIMQFLNSFQGASKHVRLLPKLTALSTHLPRVKRIFAHTITSTMTCRALLRRKRFAKRDTWY